VSMRMELDFRHGLAEPRVEVGREGVSISLTRANETAVIHVTPASLDALWLAVTIAIGRLRRC
jgi:hypothetical protein